MNSPLRSSNVVEADFGAPVTPQRSFLQRLRSADPLTLGGLALVVLVLGLLLWAGVSSVSGGVTGAGTVRVEDNRKTIKHPDGGVVRAIHVRNGDPVKQGQVVLEFDPLQPQSQVELLQGRHDSLLAEKARLEAELRGADQIAFSPELISRSADPRVAALIADQTALFQASLSQFRSETSILNQQISQLETRASGLELQITATGEQRGLILEELKGLTSLYERGYAPKTRILALQRTAASLGGTRGAQIAEMTQARQAMGETRTKLLQLSQTRRVRAADGLRTTQNEIDEIGPRLRAAQDQLRRTQVRAPVSGYVLNLTQFTREAAVAANEPLMDIVPAASPLVIDARIRPEDIDSVSVGLPAKVHLTGYSSREVSDLDGVLVKVSADRIQTASDQPPFYQADVRIPAEELRELPAKVRLQPGMPATVFVVTGKRSILEYVLDPILDTFRRSAREE